MSDPNDGSFLASPDPGGADGQVSAGFSVKVEQLAGGAMGVAVSGAVDLLTAPSMDEALTRALRDSDAVRLDLRGVTFLGSAGLSVLVDGARRAGEEGARLAIVVVGHTVLRAIEVTGLDSVLRHFDDVGAADAYLQS